MLQPLLLWHLLLFLLYITSPSLADWSLDSSGGGGAGAGGLDDPALQLRLDRNPIVANTVTDDFSTSGTTDGGVLNFEQVPPENANIGEVPANVDLGMDPSVFEVVASSRCFPPSAGKKRRRRQRVVIRRGDDSTECSAGDMFKNTPSQFKKPPGKEQQTPTADPGSKTPPSANASPRKFIPKLVPEAEELTRIFLPKDNRPSEDHSTCRKEGYSIPVCAHDDSKSLGHLSGGYANFLDPCYPASRFTVCSLSLNKWCCQRVEIALTSQTEDLFAPFRERLLTRPEILQTLETNVNPFKFVGISCLQIPEGKDFLPAY